VLKQHEAGRNICDLAKEIGVSEAPIYTWKSKYGGMDVNEAQRLKGLEDENRRQPNVHFGLTIRIDLLEIPRQQMEKDLPVPIPAGRERTPVSPDSLRGRRLRRPLPSVF
jgi:hypothetical protein